jgi:RNA polymerase sigma-70 factor (ECF subfamily)
VNICYAEARKGRRHPDDLRLLESDSATRDSELSVVDRDALERAFDRLPAEQRAVLVLQYYLDLSHPQIAEILGVPLGTVKSRASAGRQALRAALEADARVDAAGRTA